MKSYTLTWRHSSFYGSTRSRCRFDSLCVFWKHDMKNDKLAQFLRVMSFVMSGNSSLRLIKCGKLVARQATYQGV